MLCLPGRFTQPRFVVIFVSQILLHGFVYVRGHCFVRLCRCQGSFQPDGFRDGRDKDIQYMYIYFNIYIYIYIHCYPCVASPGVEVRVKGTFNDSNTPTDRVVYLINSLIAIMARGTGSDQPAPVLRAPSSWDAA